jgi:hypothetical protein
VAAGNSDLIRASYRLLCEIRLSRVFGTPSPSLGPPGDAANARSFDFAPWKAYLQPAWIVKGLILIPNEVSSLAMRKSSLAAVDFGIER